MFSKVGSLRKEWLGHMFPNKHITVAKVKAAEYMLCLTFFCDHALSMVVINKKRGMSKRSCTMAKLFPKLSGTGDANAAEMLSVGGSEGLDGLMLTCDASSCAILMAVEYWL